MDKRTELDKAKQKVMEEEYSKSYILWEDSPIDVFGVSKEIDRIKKLVNELDVIKDILYDLHGSEEYDIDLHQMGEDVENIIKQLKGIL